MNCFCLHKNIVGRWFKVIEREISIYTCLPRTKRKPHYIVEFDIGANFKTNGNVLFGYLSSKNAVILDRHLNFHFAAVICFAYYIIPLELFLYPSYIIEIWTIDTGFGLNKLSIRLVYNGQIHMLRSDWITI